MNDTNKDESIPEDVVEETSDETIPTEEETSADPVGEPTEETEEVEVIPLEKSTPVDELEPVQAKSELEALLGISMIQVKYAVSALLIAGAALMSIAIIKGNKEQSLETASKLLFEANSLQNLTTIMDEHASTPLAPLALLKLAKAHYDYENYDMAMNKYTEFKEKHPENEFLPVSELGILHCLEAKLLLDQALTGFQQHSAKYQNHFTQPQAILGEGRCLAQLDKKDDARKLFEAFIENNPDSGWVSAVDVALKGLDSYQPKIEAPTFEQTFGAPAMETKPEAIGPLLQK